MAEEDPSLPEQEMPEVDPEVEIPGTSSDNIEEIPRAEIPSRAGAASAGKSSFVTLSTDDDMSSRPTELGESSAGPSLLFAKKVVVRVVSSWIETLFSGHLEVGFGMIQHVQEILSDAEEAGLDVTGARAIVDRIIALGDKWFETVSLADDQFFKEMFLDPADKAKSDLDEATESRKVAVRKRNREELTIIGLTHDLNILDREVDEARKRLEHLQAQVAAKWTAIIEARDRESALIHQVADAERVLKRKSDEDEQWQAARGKLPGVREGVQPTPASHGKFLKKRALESLTAEAKSLLGELNSWLETIFD
ncbi:hypothetical protein PS057_17220 [Yersinia pestis]|nr:hypothetical protein [Yersinia pestis]